MSSPSTIRVGMLVVLLAGTLSAEAQKLPATAPTQPPPAQPAPTPPPLPQAAAAPAATNQSAKRAQVTYLSGQLTVTADNSSLNQILREIERLTGMKITGGVTDERVFGTYGPSDTSSILTVLLKGTGSNMMLVLNGQQAPQELVLTPRGGGPTPPNPNASRNEDRGDEDLPPQRQPHFPPAGVQPPPQPQMPPDTQPAVPTPPPPAVAPATSGTTTQTSPNGVNTPQQIYDQLMKLQQQQQKTPNAPQ